MRVILAISFLPMFLIGGPSDVKLCVIIIIPYVWVIDPGLA